jgi:hypothetical protein
VTKREPSSATATPTGFDGFVDGRRVYCLAVAGGAVCPHIERCVRCSGRSLCDRKATGGSYGGRYCKRRKFEKIPTARIHNACQSTTSMVRSDNDVNPRDGN